MMKLFPYVLVRVSGGPFVRLEQLQLRQSSRIAQKIHQCKERIDLLKNQLSEALYPVVGAQTESGTRVALINLRRDIFNERDVTPQRVKAIGDSVPEAVQEDIAQYIDLKEEIADLRRQGESAYGRELAAAKTHMDELVRADNLQKGLILSSQSLLKYGIPSYLDKSPHDLAKQERKAEQSLIKYLSRIYAKTSPFSTFTHLAAGKMETESAENDTNASLCLTGPESPGVVSHIRLNNYLYKYLKDLLLKNPEIYRRFPLRPNPTLTQEEDHYLFLTNSNNVESFQRMPLSPVLSLFHHLTSMEREGVVYREVVQTIIDNEYIEAPAEAIESYINQLIAYGFLEFNMGVSGIDPDWDLKLRQRLVALCSDIPLVDNLWHTLAQMRQIAGRYERADVAGRQQLLEQAFKQFKAICMKLHEAAGLPGEERQSAEERKAMPAQQPQAEETAEQGEDGLNPEEETFTHRTSTHFYFRPEQMFYEDTVLEGELHLRQSEVVAVVSALHNLLGELTVFEGHQDERDKMRLHFERMYGRDSAVSLLTFYEDYYREFKKPEMESVTQTRQAAQTKQTGSDGEAETDEEADQTPDKEQAERFFVPSIQERQQQNQAWLDYLGALVKEQGWDDEEQVNLSFEQVVQTNEALDRARNGRSRGSYGAFVQLFQARNEADTPRLMAVINNVFPGYGKMTSRFLHLFHEEVTTTTRQWNESLAQQDLLIEDTDASYFNANLHPPLLPYEVWMPGGHNSLPAEQQIAVTELKVGFDREEDQLRLIHEPSQKRAYVFDLGFQGRRGRSQLFSLLDQFTLADYVAPWPLVGAINKLHQADADEMEAASPQIRMHPRVVYEDRLVLRRKTWFVPKTLLPLRQPEESEWDYFARLSQWRLAQEIPDEVFIYLFDRSQMENLDAEARAKIGRDDYKPQYISFRNPFLVTLFEKLLPKVPQMLKIEEMLPNSEQLLTIAPDKPMAKSASRFVTEFVIQWYEGECP